MKTVEQLEIILRKIFEDNSLHITEQTAANDIPAWDSLTHMTVINEIEEHFKVQFTFDEASGFATIGDIVGCVDGKAK